MSADDLKFVKDLLGVWETLEFSSYMRDTDPELMREALAGVFDPEVEIIWVDTSPETGPYRGIDGAIEALNEWFESFGEFRLIPSEFIDAGDAVMVTSTQRGTGKGSGAEVEMTVFWVFELEDGKIARWREFSTRAGALEAAGR